MRTIPANLRLQCLYSVMSSVGCYDFICDVDTYSLYEQLHENYTKGVTNIINRNLIT